MHLYPDYAQIHSNTGIYVLRCISWGLPLCQATFTAHQNAHYISLYIHAQHSSLQKNTYFVNFKYIKNYFKV